MSEYAVLYGPNCGPKSEEETVPSEVKKKSCGLYFGKMLHRFSMSQDWNNYTVILIIWYEIFKHDLAHQQQVKDGICDKDGFHGIYLINLRIWTLFNKLKSLGFIH